MDKWDLIEQAFFDGTFDAAWNESEHPREGGKFISQGGGGGEGAFKRTAKGALKGAGKSLLWGLGAPGLSAAYGASAAGKGKRTRGALTGAGKGLLWGVAPWPVSGAAYGGYKAYKNKEPYLLRSTPRGREGEDALHKRGAAINRSPARHHGGRVPKAKDAGRPYHDTITTRALGGKRSTRTFAPPKGGLPAGPSFARKQGLGARVGKGVRHAIGQPRLFPHKG